MSIDRLRAHWGFSRMPFGKDLAPSMLHGHRCHGEAVARIGVKVKDSTFDYAVSGPEPSAPEPAVAVTA